MSDKKENAEILALYESGRVEKFYAKLKSDGTFNKKDANLLGSLRGFPTVKRVDVNYY